jgi:hypothetical protein
MPFWNPRYIPEWTGISEKISLDLLLSFTQALATFRIRVFDYLPHAYSSKGVQKGCDIRISAYSCLAQVSKSPTLLLREVPQNAMR